MGWDDWWLGGLKPKPPLQMLLLQKSWGYPQCLYSRSLRMPLHPPRSTPNKPRHSQGGRLLLWALSLSPFLPPLFLSQALAQMLEYLIQIKLKKKKDKQKDRVFLFCFVLFFFRLHLLWEAQGWSFLEHKSDDKIINGSRAMSYLISCIFMKGTTQLGPCSVERGNKEPSTPHPRHEECHCGDEEPRWKSLSDCILYFEKRE